jgi:raffinose/stachyose/melibiose transport system substrate-binding protein
MSSGKYAMMIMGDWFVADMLGKDPSLKLDLFPIPGSENPAKNLLVQSQLGNVLLIPNKAKHIKEAKLFLDFLSQPEQVARDLAVESMAYLPNLKDVPGPAKMRVISETLYNNYIKTGMVTTELNAFVKVDLGDLWRYYQDLMAGQKTPKEVLAAWDKKFAELMKAKGLPGF